MAARQGWPGMTLLSRLFGRRSSAPPKPPAMLNRGEFADHYVAMLTRDAPELTAERVDGHVQLRWDGGGTMRQFMGNAFAQYRAEPDALEPILAAQLAAARASARPKTGLDLTLVLPLIKSTSWLATAIAQAGEGAHLVVRPFVADLILVFAENLPDTIAYVKRQDLDGVCDEAQLVAQAMDNLTRRMPSMEVVGGDGRYRIALDGFFDASLILVSTEWTSPLALRGDPVFAIPSRDQLMVCGSDDEKAVAELADIAPRIAADDAYAISDSVLMLRDGVFRMVG